MSTIPDRSVTIDDHQIDYVERLYTNKAEEFESIAVGMAELRERRKAGSTNAIDWNDIEYHFGLRDNKDQTIIEYIRMMLHKEYEKGKRTGIDHSVVQVELALRQIKVVLT